jgi:hypothetical protein
MGRDRPSRPARRPSPAPALDWLKATYGLGQNRASYLRGLPVERMGWDKPDEPARGAVDRPGLAAILEAVEAAVADFDGLVTGQRKAFTAWSRQVQFAAAKPVKGGTAMLGLAVTPDASPRLLEPKNESWSERLKAKLPLASPADVDDEVKALLKAAWERS